MPSRLFYPLPFNLWAFIIVKNHRKTHFEKSALITPADKKRWTGHRRKACGNLNLHYWPPLSQKIHFKGTKSFFFLIVVCKWAEYWGCALVSHSQMSFYWISGRADRHKLSFSSIYSPWGLIIKVTLELASGYYCTYKIFHVIGFIKRKAARFYYHFLLELLWFKK